MFVSEIYYIYYKRLEFMCLCVCVSCMFVDQEAIATVGLWWSGWSFLVYVKWNETVTVCTSMQDEVFPLNLAHKYVGVILNLHMKRQTGLHQTQSLWTVPCGVNPWPHHLFACEISALLRRYAHGNRSSLRVVTGKWLSLLLYHAFWRLTEYYTPTQTLSITHQQIHKLYIIY
jgi:hypothetical protein